VKHCGKFDIYHERLCL